MRKIFDDRSDAERTSEDYIGSGAVRGWPYLMLINAQGQENTIATFLQTSIPLCLDTFILALRQARDPQEIKFIIDRSCEEMVDHIQATYRRRFQEKKPVSFSVVLMFPGPGQTKKALCFGLGDVMVLLERGNAFQTLKPAILRNGQNLCIPDITHDEQEKLPLIKKELRDYARVVELEAMDQIHLLSPICYGFLTCMVEVNEENQQIISLYSNSQRTLSSLLESARKKFTEKKSADLLKEKCDRARKLDRLNEESFFLSARLKRVQSFLVHNKAYKKIDMLTLFSSKLEKNDLTHRIEEHNKMKVSADEQAEYSRCLSEINTINLELSRLTAERTAILLEEKREKIEPEFSYGRMAVPENDFSIFELRVNSYLDLAFNYYYDAWIRQQSRFAGLSNLKLPLRNYVDLLRGMLKGSPIGQCLLLVLINDVDNKFFDAVFKGKPKFEINSLVQGLHNFGDPQKESIKEALIFLKSICLNEKLDEDEILKKVQELEGFLISGKHPEEEISLSSSFSCN